MTNWTRFTPANNDQYEIWVVRMSNPAVIAGNGVGQRYIFSNGQGVAHYSDQVYSPMTRQPPASSATLSDLLPATRNRLSADSIGTNSRRAGQRVSPPARSGPRSQCCG
jgi:hypothetical protein